LQEKLGLSLFPVFRYKKRKKFLHIIDYSLGKQNMDNPIISIVPTFERILTKMMIMISVLLFDNFERWITDSRALTVSRTEECSRENASNS
jgi:hypothetical protein